MMLKLNALVLLVALAASSTIYGRDKHPLHPAVIVCQIVTIAGTWGRTAKK